MVEDKQAPQLSNTIDLWLSDKLKVSHEYSMLNATFSYSQQDEEKLLKKVRRKIKNKVNYRTFKIFLKIVKNSRVWRMFTT